MKFTASEEIDVPIDAAFDMASDFAMLEESIMRRGAEVQRTDTMTAPGVGMAWDAAFDLQGKRRRAALTLVGYDPPTGMAAEAKSEGIVGAFDVELLALSRTRTRVAVALELTPKTLSARILMQPLKLAKSRLDARFEERIGAYIRDMETRYQGNV